MDFGDPQARAAFFSVYEAIPRQGPGSRASTARALSCISGLPMSPRVLDLGAGCGRQTLDLAALLPGATIRAVEAHAPFVDQLTEALTAQGLTDRISASQGDMGALPEAPGSVDLIWSEGAAYFLGIEAALAKWVPLLRPGGALALTEAVWLVEDPPTEARAFWAEEYPALRPVSVLVERFAAAGLSVVGSFALPAEDWWADFYTPMLARLDVLEAGDCSPTEQAVYAEIRGEIEIHRRLGHTYGYAFCVGQRPA